MPSEDAKNSNFNTLTEYIQNTENELKSQLSDFTKKVNLIAYALDATITNIDGNYMLYSSNTENVICFPVTSGKTYTVYKGYTMPYARIAYSETTPALNGIVTEYTDFSSIDTYKIFTSTQTGYACVKIHAYNDSETATQALASCMVYEGSYNVNKTKQHTNLVNIVDINGKNIDAAINKIECIENVNLISDFFQGIILNNELVAGQPYTLCLIFPIVSGIRYTIDKKIFTPYTRIGYTTNLPKAGDTLANFSALDNNAGSKYVTFTAIASGYATVYVCNATLEQVETIKSSAIVYKGDYNEVYNRNTNELSGDVVNANHIFYCGASRELNTLVKGITEATKYMDSVLYVDAGTYDLVQELGQSYFDNATENTLGILLKNRVHIIFSSNSKVVSNYSGSNTYAHYIYSPFNAGDYGFTLENLNLYCSNCRYAIHDERASSPNQYVNKYINCKMHIDNSDNTNWNSHHCIGGGLGANGEINIDNCVFGNDDAEIRWGISYHIPSSTQVKSYRSVIVIKDCYFESGAITLQTVDNMPSSTSDNSEYIITNNSFSKKYPGTDAQGVYNTLTHSANVREWNNICRS